MRRAPLLAPVAWGVATAVASVVSWLGVGAVTRAVTAAPEPVIPAAKIAAHHPTQLVVLPPPSGQLVAATAPSSSTPTTVPRIVVHAPTATIVVPTTIVSSGRATSPVPTTQPPSGTSGSGSGGTPTGNPGPPTTTTVPPTPKSATYSNAGGQVAVTCTGSTIVLDSAAPNDGFQATTENSGPTLVEVYFTKGKKDLVVESNCNSDGAPQNVPPSGWGVNPGQGAPNPGQF